jgi:pimeloyl-ACP methyl ester carboxylesterase
MSEAHLPISQSDRNEASHTQGMASAAPTRDGRRLFYMEHPGPTDASTPTIVFESGMAASRSWWALVQPKVAQWARAVVYDRSGLGRSTPDHQPRSLARLSDDLNDLLDHLGSGPFILVGHSGGGPIIRAAAAAQPDRIAGLLLVDVTDEACDLLFEKSFRRMEKLAHWITVLLARLDLLHRSFRKQMSGFPADVQADLEREGFTMSAIRTRGAELKGLVAAMNMLRHAPMKTHDIPTTLISGTRTDGGMTARIRAAANASHAYRATQSFQGRHVLAPNSGHNVPVTDPDLIAAEIKRLSENKSAAASTVARQSTS